MTAPQPLDPLVTRARDLAVAALELSGDLDKGVLVPYGGRVSVAAVGLTLRARRLVRAAVRLADEASWLEAQILLRTLLEYVITLEWIAADPELRILSWWQADERSFDVMVSEVSSLISQPIEIPAADDAARRDLIEQIAKEAAAAGAPPYPSLQERARQVRGSLAYSLLFRLYSQGGVHPFRQSLLPLLQDMPERKAVLVHAHPKEGPVDDPYYLCAVLLVIALERLSGLEPGLQLPSVEPLKRQLMDLKRDIDAEGGAP